MRANQSKRSILKHLQRACWKAKRWRTKKKQILQSVNYLFTNRCIPWKWKIITSQEMRALRINRNIPGSGTTDEDLGIIWDIPGSGSTEFSELVVRNLETFFFFSYFFGVVPTSVAVFSQYQNNSVLAIFHLSWKIAIRKRADGGGGEMGEAWSQTKTETKHLVYYKVSNFTTTPGAQGPV